jgi:patatin-related protein
MRATIRDCTLTAAGRGEKVPTVGEAPRRQASSETRPEIRYTQELRFAVVMYGGASLAIYINGVAQELLALVRATAPDGKTALTATEDLRGTERVYRELGQLVSWQAVGENLPADTDPIRTRFVVDILSGTSAGGLNAIFLGKALANEQDLQPLRALWRDEADLALLVNDRDSQAGTTLTADSPPTSVLNSKRMYWQLLSALDSMDRESEAAPASRLVDELDCWITTTDIRGLLLPIDLYDRFVFERRHRKVFHFVSRSEDGGPGRNDFERSVNPFLAFAGRATSAFPFAFEPMQLADIDEVVRAEPFRDAYGKLGSRAPEWQRFFEEYLKPGSAETMKAAADQERVDAVRTASFGDGGYLDNKPFTYATETLARRRSTVPVDRRLIYVEPDPNDRPPVRKLLRDWRKHGPLADIDDRSPERPNALENVAAALLTLPRVETIREDIERLLERNRDLARLSDVARSVDIALRDEATLTPFPPGDVWRTMSAREWMNQVGVQYAAYYRLHVASVLDDLARTITRAAGFDEESDEEAAIRCYVQAWANDRFPEAGTGEQSQNELLVRFDLEYRLRRIQFLQHRIDELLRFDDTAESRFRQFGATVETMSSQSDWSQTVAAALYGVKVALDETLGALRAAGRSLWSRGANPLLPSLDALGLDRGTLFAILDGAHTREESVARAAERLDEQRLAKFDAVAQIVSEELKVAVAEARTNVLEALKPPPAETLYDGVDPVAVAFAALLSDFDLYWAYDSIIFPVAYGYLSEASRVEVVRISPEDATSIVDESERRRRKLAGTGVQHFGGFLDARWRRNDMLWGRLDAAERIIDTVLFEAPKELRAELLERAQLAIVEDEFETAERSELSRQLVEIALAARPGQGPELDEDERRRLHEIVRKLRTPKQILAFMKQPDGYEVNRQLDLDGQLRTAGRAAVVTGGVLDGISENPRVRFGTKWIARLGRLAWGLAELASPRFPWRSGRYWFSLAGLVALAMILLGIALNSDPTTHLGWVFLLALVGVAVTTWVLRDIFDKRRRELAAEPRLEPRPPPPRRQLLASRAAWVGAVAVVLVVALAVVEIVVHLGSDLKDLFGL